MEFSSLRLFIHMGQVRKLCISVPICLPRWHGTEGFHCPLPPTVWQCTAQFHYPWHPAKWQCIEGYHQYSSVAVR